MNTLIRTAFVVAIAFVLAVCILGLRFACDPSDLRELIQAERCSEQLQQFRRGFYRHFEAKEQVVREVIAQQCSLSEALAQWHELDQEWIQEVGRNWPRYASGLEMAHQQARSEADHYYRLISWRAEVLLTGQPEEAATILRRLEKDYQQLQRHPAGGLNCSGDAAPLAR